MANNERKTYAPAADQFLKAPKHKVYLKQYWQDDWEHVPHLHALSITLNASPGISQATIEWIYGQQMASPSSYEPSVVKPYHLSNVIGKYVKIEFEVSDRPDEESSDFVLPKFVGQIQAPHDQWAGDAKGVDGDPVARGKQTFLVADMTSLLDKTPIMSTFVAQPHGVDEDKAVVEIGRCLNFNKINSGWVDPRDMLEGNMSFDPLDEDVHAFDALGGSPGTNGEEQSKVPQRWSLGHAVDHLVHYHAPRNADGDQVVKFKLRRNACWEGLLQHNVVLDNYEGQTLFQVLNRLVDRRRGLSWQLVPAEDDSFEIVLAAAVEEEIALEDGGKLVPDEERVFDVDVTNDHLCQVEQTGDGHNKYDQVVVRGARRGSIINLGDDSDIGDARVPFVGDWNTKDDELEDDYYDGWKDVNGFDNMMPMETVAAIDRHRRQPKFERLFSWYRIKKDWNGMTHGEQPVFPKLDEDGQPTSESEPIHVAGLRLMRQMPMYAGVDYSEDRIGSGAAAADIKKLPEGGQPELRTAEMYVHMTNSFEGDTKMWLPVGPNSFRPGWCGGWPFTLSVTMQDSAPGFIVKVHGGARQAQHAISGNDRTGGDMDLLAMKHPISAEDDTLLVAYVQGDSFVEERRPTDDKIEDHNGERPDVVRRKVIRVPDAHLDWVPAYTVVGAKLEAFDDAGGNFVGHKLQATTKGAFVRDDRPRLKSIAQMAEKWYLTTRRPIKLSWSRLRKFFALGDVIGNLSQTARADDEEHFDLAVNTPITSITYDLKNGRTEVETSYAEMDHVGLRS